MRITIILFCIVMFLSCEDKKKEYAPMQKEVEQNEAMVKEVKQTSGYTYLLVTNQGQEFWMAVSKTDVKKGEKVYFEQAMEMQDFRSEELDRVFDQIFFVEGLSKSPITAETKKARMVKNTKKEMQYMLDSIKIDPAPGGQSIRELYENAEDYNEKSVKVRGQVVKVNSEIMDRNWVHLMDGTKGNSRSDLTFTTQEVVQVGDTVTLEGILAIDREFGAGYVYPVIVEKAVLK